MSHESDIPYTGEIPLDASDQTHDILSGFLEDLGFEETPALAEARAVILAMLHEEGEGDATRRRLAWVEYDMVGEELVNTTIDAQDIDKRAKMHIALLVYKALLFHGAGQIDRFTKQLELAYTYAANRQFEPIASDIDAVLDELARQQRNR